jgi:3-hydroxyisobutyrate dehydrogenase
MGLTIACRLRGLGHPVFAYNRTPERGRQLQSLGGTLLNSPADVADASKLILVCVTGPQDSAEVLLGSNGVAQTAASGLVVADLSTIDPQTSRELARQLRERGIHMLDVPVAGSIHDALRGTLGLLVGGDQTHLEQVRSTLSRVGNHIYHFGPNGSGCAAKLALNLLVAAMTKALAESLALLTAFGLDKELFLNALSTSALASPLYERTGRRALDSDFTPRFALRDLHKDISLLNKVSADLHIDLGLAQSLLPLIARHVENYGAQDYSVLIAAEEQGYLPSSLRA